MLIHGKQPGQLLTAWCTLLGSRRWVLTKEATVLETKHSEPGIYTGVDKGSIHRFEEVKLSYLKGISPAVFMSKRN